MRSVRAPRDPLAATLLTVMLLAACSSPTGSPSAGASASATSLVSASPTASPTASPSPTPSPTPTAVVTPTPVPTAKPVATGPSKVTLVRIASGLSNPDGITSARDGTARLFIVQRGGQVRVIDADGNLSPTPFLDISGFAGFVSGGEQGLLGLAFHPNFAANGRLFVDYTRSDGNGAWEDVVAELNAPGDRSVADPSTERVLLAVPDPYVNHNGGQLAFGQDGFLYIAMGDGGSGGDPHGNGQNRQVLLGKILRIDVNKAHAAGKEYAIPPTNPWASGVGGLPEIWAYGLRNPWRFSFDRANGDLYIGDVGQNTWEEVDRQAGGSRGGQNYGWNAYEGRHCFLNCAGVSYVPPIVEYSHSFGCAVTGGYVYRGSAQPALRGFYIYGDYCSGTIWTFPAGIGNKTAKAVASTGLSIASFGEGEDGEIYLADISGGGIYRIVAG